MRDIIKSALKVGVATLAGLLGWVVAGKILAFTLGAAGIGLFGLMRQLLQNLTLVGSFNGQTALVQGIASRGQRPDQIRFAEGVFWIQSLIAGSLAIGLIIAAPWLGPILIPHAQSVILLRWLAFAMLAMVAQNYVIGILNGHRLINELMKSQMVGPLVVMLLVFPMVWLVRGGYPSGFILMLGGPAVVMTIVAGLATRRLGWLPSIGKCRINRSDGISFFRMSAVLLLTGTITTGTQFFMSWLVAKKMGLAEAGQFWTAWTLSMSYVTLVLGSLGTYYMPSLSRITDPQARRDLIHNYLHLSLIAMPLLISFVVVFKPWLILGMFSHAMLPALRVMHWMLIGDLFKGISWVLAFPMLAFSDMKWFFWTDVLFSIGMAGTAWFWLSLGGGIEGLGVIFLLTYIVYMLVMSYYVWDKHGLVWKMEEVYQFIGGLSLVLIVSVVTWRSINVQWLPLLFLCVGSSLSLIWALRGKYSIAQIFKMKSDRV